MKRFVLTLTIVLATAFGTAASAGAANNGLASKVVRPDAVYADKTYADWAAAWWQWALSIPATAHPLLDTAPCGTGQSGPVFFLGGSFGDATVVRDCTVPSGKALFFPILNTLFSPIIGDPPTINGLRAASAGVMDSATDLQVDLDGKSLKSLAPFREQSPAFDFTLPDDNLFGAAAGTYSLAVDDGFYVMIEPLAPGARTLHFGGTLDCCAFTLDITYNLTVTP